MTLRRYLISLYFAVMTLTTVGYGDVTPRSLPEYAVLTVIMFAGGFMWAYIIGSVCGTVATLDLVKIQHQQRYDQVNNMILDVRVTPGLQSRIRNFLFQSEEVARHIEYSKLIGYLSPLLQTDLCEELSRCRLRSVPYFSARTNGFRLELFKRMTSALFVPHESITERRLMIIVNQGLVGSNGRIFIRGGVLNLNFLLTSDHAEPARAQAFNYVEVQLLSRSDLEEVVALYPLERVYILWFRVFYSMVLTVKCLDFKSPKTIRANIFGIERRDPPHDPAIRALHEEVSRLAASVATLTARLTPTDVTTTRLNGCPILSSPPEAWRRLGPTDHLAGYSESEERTSADTTDLSRGWTSHWHHGSYFRSMSI